MKTKIAAMTVFLLVLSASSLLASPDARISYAEGTGFVLVSNGERQTFDIAVDDVVGRTLAAGDTILTDEGGFIEIELLGGNGGFIKIVENTTFTLMSLDESGGGVFRVSYGRIRVKVASLLGSSKIWVTGHDTVAGVRGTDFGYDMFYDQAVEGGERQTSVYVFEGEVDVLKYDRDNTSKIDLMGKEPLILKSGKMVQTKSTDTDTRLKAASIDQNIIEYWNEHPIKSKVDSALLVQDEPLTVSEDLNMELGKKTQDLEFAGKFTMVAGVGLMVAGGLVRAFGVQNPTLTSVSTGLMTVGGASLALSTGLLVGAAATR